MGRRFVGPFIAPGYGELARFGEAVVLAEDEETRERVVLRYVPMRALTDRLRYAAFSADLARLVDVPHWRTLPFRRFVADPRLRRPGMYVGLGAGGALVYDAVPGVGLGRLLDRGGPLGAEASLVVAMDAAAGLADAHAAGVRNNAVTPRRILVTGDGRVLLAGLALGAVEEPDLLRRAPESWGHAPVSADTDRYALGCVLFECLTGRPPFPRAAPFSLMAAHTTAPPPLDDVPAPVRPLLAGALAKEPPRDLTPARVAALAAAAYGPDWETRGRGALAAWAAAFVRPIPKPPPVPPVRQDVPVAVRAGCAIAIAIVVVLVLVAAVTALTSDGDDPPSAAPGRTVTRPSADQVTESRRS
ncbi:hypothetical protein [Actinomadura sp. 3N508]|uniref:hypothetical protein n=1 Tax=Actinomadura sp. 3N508 TaxID=3375153 RepID=UPI00378CF41C